MVAATLRIAICMVVMLGFWSSEALAAPGDILFADDFDTGASCSALSPNWSTTSTSNSGIGTHTSSSGQCSLYTRHGVVSVTSTSVNLSTAVGAQLTAWVRKGADSFSEDPDGNEDLYLEYQDASGFWTILQTFGATSLPDGQITNANIALPAGALHSSFKLRWRQAGGSGTNFDYWHVDNVEVKETGTAPPPPPVSGLTANSCDNFEGGLINFTTTNSTRAGTSSQTYNSANNSLYTRHGVVTVTSLNFDTSSLTEISVWVRRGSDSFSENPESNENLVIEALTNTGTWTALETFNGNGTQGQIFNRNYTPTAAMKHANFRIRFRQTGGSGSNFDYWHVDDLCFTGAPPNINVTKTSQVLSDPVNGTTNPKAIPGAVVRYSITVTNTGNGSPDVNSVNIGDVLGADTVFYAGDLNGSGSPFVFTDGTGSNASGVTMDFLSLGSTSDGVEFLDFSNAPVVPTIGYDINVASFSMDMDGIMNGSTGTANPSFTVVFHAKVE